MIRNIVKIVVMGDNYRKDTRPGRPQKTKPPQPGTLLSAIEAVNDMYYKINMR
jgi:hypothetical protein